MSMLPSNGWAVSLLPRGVAENRVFRLAMGIVLVGAFVLALQAIAVHLLVSSILAQQRVGGLQEQETVTQRYRRLQNALLVATGDRLLLQKVRPRQDDLIAFVQNLEVLAFNAGVRQTIETPARLTEEKAVAYSSPVVRYQIVVEGPLDRVISYLEALSTIPELALVEKITMKSDDRENLAVHTSALVEIALAVRE